MKISVFFCRLVLFGGDDDLVAGITCVLALIKGDNQNDVGDFFEDFFSSVQEMLINPMSTIFIG